MATLTIIIVDGFVFAAILFLLSVGLTLILGVLRILNISHGGIYALGAYMGTFLALKILDWGWNPYLTYVMLLAGALIIGLIVGPLIERLFLRRVYGQAEAIQLLLTFAILLILEDLIKLIWGTTPIVLGDLGASSSVGADGASTLFIDTPITDQYQIQTIQFNGFVSGPGPYRGRA